MPTLSELRLPVSAVFLFCPLVLISLPAVALTFAVNDLNDTVDIVPGDSVCQNFAGGCSLRAAVMEANRLAGSHTIELLDTLHPLTIFGPDDDSGAAGDLDITAQITLMGQGALDSIIDAQGASRVVHIHSGGSLITEDLTLQSGRAGTSSNHTGGGVRAEGAVTLRRTRLIGNVANLGGGLFAFGQVDIEDSLLADNQIDPLGFTNPWGAALRCQSCTLNLYRSAVVSNAPGAIGTTGAVSLASATFDIVNTTISGNIGPGVQIDNSNGSLRFSTAIDNQGSQLHFYSFSGADVLEVAASVLQPVAGYSTCSGNTPPTSSGYNIIGDNSCALATASDLAATDAQLESLADNGGPTLSHYPAAASPAIDHVPAASCMIAEDQRKLPRPAPGTSWCDVGSIEAGSELVFIDRFEPTP